MELWCDRHEHHARFFFLVYMLSSTIFLCQLAYWGGVHFYFAWLRGAAGDEEQPYSDD